MKIDGACHCGKITYTAEIDPERASICHCTDCQTLTGTAFRTVVPAAGSGFQLTGGQPKIYLKTAESGSKRVQAFCPECGTPIYSSAVTDAQVYMVRVGSIRQRAQLRPQPFDFRYDPGGGKGFHDGFLPARPPGVPALRRSLPNFPTLPLHSSVRHPCAKTWRTRHPLIVDCYYQQCQNGGMMEIDPPF